MRKQKQKIKSKRAKGKVTVTAIKQAWLSIPRLDLFELDSSTGLIALGCSDTRLIFNTNISTDMGSGRNAGTGVDARAMDRSVK